MSLYKTISHDIDTQVFIWNITETEQELKETVVLQEKHQARLDGMLSEQHRKGFLSVRKLLQTAGYTDFDLMYDANGKPHLKDGKYISITHSFEFAAIIISNENVGIDIEQQREKIIRIANKFCGTEWEYLKEENQFVEQLSVIWGAKEALYKMCDSRSLSFKQDMHIQPFQLTENEGKAVIDSKELSYKNQFVFHFESFENYTLVFALEHE